jgi:hypothetical protein
MKTLLVIITILGLSCSPTKNNSKVYHIPITSPFDFDSIYLPDTTPNYYTNYHYQNARPAIGYVDTPTYDTIYGAVFVLARRTTLMPNADTTAFKVVTWPVKNGDYAYAVYEVTKYMDWCKGHGEILHKGACEQEKRKLLKIYLEDDTLFWYSRLIDLTKYYEFIPEDQF